MNSRLSRLRVWLLRWVCVGLFLGIAAAQSQFVENLTSDKPAAVAWRWSAASLAASQAADAASSWHRSELNPLLRSGSGDFGAKGLALKATTTAGMLILERRMIRRHPEFARPFTVLNFVAAGVTSGIAARNWRSR